MDPLLIILAICFSPLILVGLYVMVVKILYKKTIPIKLNLLQKLLLGILLIGFGIGVFDWIVSR